MFLVNFYRDFGKDFGIKRILRSYQQNTFPFPQTQLINLGNNLKLSTEIVLIESNLPIFLFMYTKYIYKTKKKYKERTAQNYCFFSKGIPVSLVFALKCRP